VHNYQKTIQMRKLFPFLLLLGLVAIVSFAFVDPTPQSKTNSVNTVASKDADGAINWMTWEEAVKAAEKEPRKIFVDCYTDWCGWCKRMDQTTFQDEAVVAFMNKNFYAVKFDAEQKENIKWRNMTFQYVKAGRRGVHQLAYSLLDGKLSYPSFVYLNEKFDRISISKGYKQPEDLKKELEWVAGNHYKNTSFKDYSGK
jgi:thioredoxin-related protein